MNVDHSFMLVKYAEGKKEKRFSLPDPVKSLVAGGLAGISSLPIPYPLDASITNKQVEGARNVGNSVRKNFFKKHYSGIGLKALKIAPAMAIALTMNPIYKKFLDKHIGTTDPILESNE